MTENPDVESPPSNEETSRQLERMLANPSFTATPQQVALLTYVVNQVLAGRADLIKGYTVATEVFGRGSNFNQNTDPIVSIQAARLRRALVNYYNGAGKNDPLRIDIPKGTYVPVFSRQRQAQTTAPPTRSDYFILPVKSTWPAVLVRPLRNLAGDPEFDFWGIGLASELAGELNRYPDIRVMTLDPSNAGEPSDRHRAQFKVDGNVRRDGSCIKLTVQLTDTRSGHLARSESHRFPLATTRFIALQEGIAQGFAVKIAGHHGHIAHAMAASGDDHPPSQQTDVYRAVLRYYEHLQVLSPKTFSTALAALQRAVAIDPDCGQAWAMLAHIFAEIYALGIEGVEAPLEKAFKCGQNAIRLLPDDQRARTYMAYIHLLRNDLAAARAETERAFQLGPQTLFMLDGIGYLMTLLGDWERGPDLINHVIRLNPFYNNGVHFALWLDWLREEHYDEAYQETLNLNRPQHFWDHLTRAATFGLLGHIEDGRKAADELLRLRPDFPAHGRQLIGHYIKFDDIAERVVDGLGQLGMKLGSR